MLLATVRVVLVVVVALFLFAQYARRTSMFFPDRFPDGQWDTSTLLVKPSDHQFTTEDGVRLHAWLFRAAEPDAPVMIWCHGNAGNLTDRGLMASNFARRGVSVFVFDYRGFGKSEGKPSEGKLYRDALAAYDYVAKAVVGDRLSVVGEGNRQPTTDHRQPVVLYGESVGGPYAAHVAKERKVRCVIIENSFPSLLAIGNALYRPLPLGYTAPFAMRTARWLNDAGVPVLVMHGREDEVIPFALGQQLYDELRVPKELLVSERAGHCEIPMIDSVRYYETVTRFIRTAGAVPPS